MATNTPVTGISVFAPVLFEAHDHRRDFALPVSWIRLDLGIRASGIFGFARAFSCMIFDARSVSRRCTSVTSMRSA